MSGTTTSGATINKAPNVQTISGNRVVVEFGGMQLGLIQSCRASDDYGMEPASGIGDIHVQEHVPTRATHRLNVSGMALFKKNLRSAGVFPENGNDVLKGNEFTISYYSKDTNDLVMQYTGCVIGSCDVAVDAHRIIVQSGQVMARDRTGTYL